MNNIPYPFNKNEHIFDFKVKVNFQNGNVSLTAPQIVNPPALFNSIQHQMIQNNRIMNVPYNKNIQAYPSIQTSNPQLHLNYNKQKIISPIYNRIQQNRNNNSFKQHSYTINDSMQVVECVICQKSFNINEFDNHLQVHKQRRMRQNLNSNQKDYSTNGIMITQNSFNNPNDSYLNNQHNINNSQYSFKHNQSQLSHTLSKGNNSFKHNQSQLSHASSIGNLSNLNVQRQLNNLQNILTDQINNQSFRNKAFHPHQQIQNPNESGHLLGQIQNPILLLKANQQSFASLQSHHHNNSLDYSKSYEHLIQPQFHQRNINSRGIINLSNNQANSFGQQRNQFIGPSFYNSNNSSLSLQRKFVASSNQNRIIGQNIQQIHSPNFINSFHSNTQQSFHNGSINNNSKIYSQSSNPANHYHSANSSQMINNRSLPENGNYLLQYFKPIQSRCTVQHINYNGPVILKGSTHNNVSLNQNLYSSHHDQPQKNIKGTKSHQNQPFFQDDSLSSISNASRISMTQYSDFQQINKNINNINKQIQNKGQKHTTSIQQNNQNKKINNNNPTQSKVGFFKKKKDHMINSKTSYYDKKFKDQSSSSQEQQDKTKNQRLSYAERLNEKKLSDSNQNASNLQYKSLSMTKNLKKQGQMTSSKISQLSSQSKTKLPVNYLARQDFISTSSKISKSTYKSTVKNN